MSIPREVYKTVAWGVALNKPFMTVCGMGDRYRVAFGKATVREYKYILVAKDYFSKWAKVIVIKDFVSTMVAEFIWIHIIYWGVPETIMADTGEPFKS